MLSLGLLIGSLEKLVLMKIASTTAPSFIVKRDRLSDQVARSLEAMILAREIAVGESLPSERDLMERYGVGRPAVREALLWLNKKGFVSLNAGERARVTEPNPVDLREHLAGAATMLERRPEGMQLFQQTRLFTEIALAREAARAAKPSDLRKLALLLEANRASTNDLDAFAETDDAFHFGVASISRNSLITALYNSVLGVLEDQRHTSLRHPDALKAAIDCHIRVFEAIKNHDPDLAEKEMRRHLKEVETYYWSVRTPGLKDRKSKKRG